jgi:hypothetical protein
MPTLGVPGYTFADLHDPDRLQSLYELFCEEVRAADSAFWIDWDAYRRDPDASRPPIVLSNLLVRMAPFVSRFVRRLFDVDAQADSLSEATRAQDDLFRFKVDFVRRRALPLVKGGSAGVVSTPEDEAIVERMIALHGHVDRELAVARAAAQFSIEKSDARSTTPELPECEI